MLLDYFRPMIKPMFFLNKEVGINFDFLHQMGIKNKNNDKNKNDKNPIEKTNQPDNFYNFNLNINKMKKKEFVCEYDIFGENNFEKIYKKIDRPSLRKFIKKHIRSFGKYLEGKNYFFYKDELKILIMILYCFTMCTKEMEDEKIYEVFVIKLFEENDLKTDYLNIKITGKFFSKYLDRLMLYRYIVKDRIKSDLFKINLITNLKKMDWKIKVQHPIKKIDKTIQELPSPQFIQVVRIDKPRKAKIIESLDKIASQLKNNDPFMKLFDMFIMGVNKNYGKTNRIRRRKNKEENMKKLTSETLAIFKQMERYKELKNNNSNTREPEIEDEDYLFKYNKNTNAYIEADDINIDHFWNDQEEIEIIYNNTEEEKIREEEYIYI